MGQEPERICGVRVPPGQAGLTVLDFLSARFTYMDREEWRRELAAGRILVNQERAEAGSALAAGDHLSYLLPNAEEPPVAADFTVVYEDEHLLVADKPAPLPCHPGGRYFRHTLWNLLRERCGLAAPFFVNRLDRETSGLVVVARNREAARRCGLQWRERSVAKRYLVLVEGDFPLPELEARGHLAPDRAGLVRKKVRFFPESGPAPSDGRFCSTRLRRLACANGLTLLEARPATGRCHQIRATLCSLGFPVAGDKIYGLDEGFFLRFLQDQLSPQDISRLRLPRQALHGTELGFRHPADGRPLLFVSPLPRDIRALLE